MYEDLIELIKTGKFKKARHYLDKSLLENSDSIYLLAQMANVLWNLNKDNEAIGFIRRAETIDANDGLLEFTAGRILWSMEKYEDSIVRWDKLLNVDVTCLAEQGFGKKWAMSLQNDARYYKADCLYNTGKDAEAESLLRKHMAHRRRGLESDFTIKQVRVFLRTLKYSDKGKRWNCHSSKIGVPTREQGNRIQSYMKKLGDNRKAIKYLKRKCKEFPMDYWLKTELAEYLFLQRDRNCLRYANEAYEIAPDDLLVVYNLGYSLYVNERYDEACELLRVIQDKSLDYIAYYEYGEGMQWAKKLKRDTENLLNRIKEMKRIGGDGSK